MCEDVCRWECIRDSNSYSFFYFLLFLSNQFRFYQFSTFHNPSFHILSPGHSLICFSVYINSLDFIHITPFSFLIKITNKNQKMTKSYIRINSINTNPYLRLNCSPPLFKYNLSLYETH